ncbi:MAG: HIT family hydrolase [Acidobacteria bacterium RIFCSPLOWO2_02_FULL_60_20]|nr:MAG: HIT family hydrolase [Acidobacteria bacterium RIFCSPLOWO2_02_FULL_60_20]
MDYLWSPWRYRYVTGAEPTSGCVFCQKVEQNEDEKNLILYRGLNNFVLLNIYPYTSGHLMVAPYRHIAQLAQADDATWSELMMLTRKAEQAIQTAYKPEGINLGMNLGKSAGAGIADHIHMHVLPRWQADSNFISVIGETRVLPEALSDTYRKLKPLF